MTTRPAALPHAHSTPGAFLRRYFYFCMSLLIAVVIVYGFSQTIGQNLLHASPLPPFILTIHAVVFPGWVLFFILQSALVRTHNVPLHRTLGWFGLALGITLIVLGYFTAITMDRFQLQNHTLDSPAFLIVQLMDLVSFAVFFALAIYWRRRPEYHRRLILIASCALTDAAFGRFPLLPLAFSPAAFDALILLGLLRDLTVDRRVHQVYRYGFPLLILFQIFCMQTFLHAPSCWVRIATGLLR